MDPLMARTFGRLLCTIWADEDFLALSADAKVLYVAFLSQQDITPAGILPWTERRWRRWLNGDQDRARVAFDELVLARFVLADEDTSEVFIRSFIEHDGRLVNSKLAASVRIAVEQIRSSAIARAVDNEHPGVFPRRRAIDGQSTYKPKAQTVDADGLNDYRRWDPDVTHRNGEEETVILDGPSDERLDRSARLRLLTENGAPAHLTQRPHAEETA